MKKNNLTSFMKASLGLIFATIILKFMLGSDITHLVALAEKGGSMVTIESIILLIKTIVITPLACGIGFLFFELIDIFSKKVKK
jgi:uncharacterized membrane protein YkvI